MAQPSVSVWTMSWNSQEKCWDFDYFFALDVLSGPQCEAVMRGWGLAPFWYNETMLHGPLSQCRRHRCGLEVRGAPVRTPVFFVNYRLNEHQ